MQEATLIREDSCPREVQAEAVRLFNEKTGGPDRMDDPRQDPRVTIECGPIVGPRGGIRRYTTVLFRDNVCKDVDEEDAIIARLDGPGDGDDENRDDEDRDEREFDEDEDDAPMYAGGMPLDEYVDLLDYLAEQEVASAEAAATAEMDADIDAEDGLINEDTNGDIDDTEMTSGGGAGVLEAMTLKSYAPTSKTVRRQAGRFSDRAAALSRTAYEHREVAQLALNSAHFFRYFDSQAFHYRDMADVHICIAIHYERRAEAANQVALTVFDKAAVMEAGERSRTRDRRLIDRAAKNDRLRNAERAFISEQREQFLTDADPWTVHASLQADEARAADEQRAQSALEDATVVLATQTDDAEVLRSIVAIFTVVENHAFDVVASLIDFDTAAVAWREGQTLALQKTIDRATTPTRIRAVVESRRPDPLDSLWDDKALAPYERLAMAAGAENEPSFFRRMSN